MRRGWGCRGMIIQACLLTVLSIIGWMGPAGDASAEEGMPAPVEVSWSPIEPKQGEVLHLWVNAPEGMYVEKGEMLSRPIHFSPSATDAVETASLLPVVRAIRQVGCPVRDRHGAGPGRVRGEHPACGP